MANFLQNQIPLTPEKEGVNLFAKKTIISVIIHMIRFLVKYL